MQSGRAFTRSDFVATLCKRDAPLLARMGHLVGPFTHYQGTGNGYTVLDATPGKLRIAQGRQVKFTDGPGGSQRVSFLDRGSVVTEATLTPAEVDVLPFATWAVEFLYAATVPNLSAYRKAENSD